MTTDRELLERAAVAAGYRYIKPTPDYDGRLGLVLCDEHGRPVEDWAPLTDDGDALRLAVRLGMSLEIDPPHVAEPCAAAGAPLEITRQFEPLGTDPYAATRRAIVRAAAAMKE